MSILRWRDKSSSDFMGKREPLVGEKWSSKICEITIVSSLGLPQHRGTIRFDFSNENRWYHDKHTRPIILGVCFFDI